MAARTFGVDCGNVSTSGSHESLASHTPTGPMTPKVSAAAIVPCLANDI